MDYYPALQDAAMRDAAKSGARYTEANTRYGTYLQKFLGHAPHALAVAHLLIVNSNLESAPKRRDQRRGFMAVSVEDARLVGIDLTQAEDPLTCAYLWSRAINKVALNLFTTNSGLFAKTPDFWKCAYLNYWLGDTAFNVLWSLASPGEADSSIWGALVYAVKNKVNKRIGRWSPFELKMLILSDCVYMFEVWRIQGTSVIAGPGMEPVPTSTDLVRLKLPRG